MTGSRPFIFWMTCWKYISPIAIFIVLIASIAETAKDTAKYSAYVGCKQVRHRNSTSSLYTITLKMAAINFIPRSIAFYNRIHKDSLKIPDSNMVKSSSPVSLALSSIFLA